MSQNEKTFGSRLYSELRELSGYDLITGIMDYKAIQKLKIANREETLKLFQGSSYEVIQLLKRQEPEDVAKQLVANFHQANEQAANNAAAAAWIIINAT